MLPGQSRITYYDRDGSVRFTSSAAYYNAEGQLVHVEGEPPDDDPLEDSDDEDEGDQL